MPSRFVRSRLRKGVYGSGRDPPPWFSFEGSGKALGVMGVMGATNPSSRALSVETGSAVAADGFVVVVGVGSKGISMNPFFRFTRPLFHILTPKMIATMMLTVGKMTPIAIVAAVLKPPLSWPSLDAAGADGITVAEVGA